jgi:flavodoxin
MKTIIVYTSVHHQNTEKVAKVMADELGADLFPIGKVQPAKVAEYDLVGFGSGIYYGKHHSMLLDFVDLLPERSGTRAFVFSTSGEGGTARHAALKEKLGKHGFTIIDEFACKGWDTWGPMKLIGGINKGRPNEYDLEGARLFARELKNTK